MMKLSAHRRAREAAALRKIANQPPHDALQPGTATPKSN